MILLNLKEGWRLFAWLVGKVRDWRTKNIVILSRSSLPFIGSLTQFFPVRLGIDTKWRNPVHQESKIPFLFYGIRFDSSELLFCNIVVLHRYDGVIIIVAAGKNMVYDGNVCHSIFISFWWWLVWSLLSYYRSWFTRVISATRGPFRKRWISIITI